MKILLPGNPTTGGTENAATAAFFADIAPLKVKHERTIDATARGVAPAEVMVEADPGDVVELEFAGGIRQWVSVAQLQQDMERSGHRSAELGGVTLPLQPIGSAQGAESRGAVDLALKGLKLFGFDPVQKTADLAERKIIEKFEDKLDPPAGLYPLGGPTAAGKAITAAAQFDASGPALVFLHGTASSTAGSFGELAGVWDQLSKQYGKRIYGFQHKTLSVSPVANALGLAELIPPGATLHLVSHSRGGLVGELLCIRKITPEQLEAFRTKAARRDEEATVAEGEKEDRAKARAAELVDLQKLSDLLEKRKFKIERFVRVACPARGTILASGRLDLYLSLITSAIGMAVKGAPYLQPIHEFLKATTIEIARRRTRPEGLPGFEAQMPESPLIHLLNNTGLESQADLAVIAGDIEMGGGFWKSLGVLATNLFYLEQHDLVVNTAAMSAGMARTGGTWVFFDQGAEVSHFNYFRNPSSRDRLLSWLGQPAGQHGDAQFKLHTRSPIAATSRSAGARAAGANAPALFILPGIMGTLLKDDTGLLWLDQQRLSMLGMEALKIDADGVETAGIVQAGYQQLEQHFSSSHQVVLFDYDWRHSVEDAAKRLAAQVKSRDDDGKVVRIVAHSMGGLVARAMIALNPALWKSVCDKGGRLVQLGTPNRGSFVIPRLLWGVEQTVQMLAMLDPDHSMPEVCGILAAYPGVLDMLPETEDGRFFDHAWWSHAHGQLASPSVDELRRAKDLRAKIAGGDRTGIIYVAGTGDSTPADLAFEAGAAVWPTTDDGDGTVPYALGRIDGVETYYVNAVHGELANEPTAFDGYAELLATGKTKKLPQTVAPRARAVGVAGVLRGPEPVLFPTEEELLAAALGKPRRRSRPSQRALPALNVAVRHGDLRRSPLPLVVGHYLGDKIVNAEWTLDEQFEGRLSRRAELGLYPGEEGTVELVLAPQCHPPGALIVGLGQIGEITMEKVRRAVMEATLRYAVALLEQPADTAARDTSRRAGLSALLLGTNGGRALRIVDSVAAIVSGVLDANQALAAAKQIDKVCFDTLHIVEIYETVAAQALYAARQFAQRLRGEQGTGQEVVVAPYVQPLGRGRAQPPLNPFETGWWPRIEITQEVSREGKATGDFRFSIPTSRAGLDEQIASSQMDLISDLVEEAIVSPTMDTNAASDLFQLLVPNSLKPRLDIDADNAVVVVDRSTASIPWEMLGRQKIDGGMDFLALKMGLLRQFKTTKLQPRQPDSRSFKAVVIGDAQQPFAPLPGAVAEANAVARILRANHYEATLATEQNFLTNLRAILAADYRILHIAAHGLFDPDPGKPSGVVLGQDRSGKIPKFLTSREIRQMPAMPELVFLNCCHIGKITDPAAELAQRARLQTTNALAASLAEELINKGVKVVVAAGWAVHDGAAEIFATAFYGQMLEGQCFGDAVRHARRAAKDRFPSVNTWAAYQCYGSPDYKLEGTGDDGGKSRDGSKYLFATRTEFLNTARDLHAEASDGRVRTNKAALRKKLETLEQSLPAHWRDGEMLSTLGLVWGDLADFPRAITLLHEALTAENGSASFRAAEQLSNFEDRVASAEAGKRGATKAIRDRWTSAQKRLDQLLAFGETSERWSLLAACERRRAQVTSGAEGEALRAQSIAHYRKAYEISVAANNPDPYPGLNWLTDLFLSPQSKAAKKILVTELPRLLAVIEARIESDTEKEIWRRIQRGDALLLHHLTAGDLPQAASVEQVKSAYADAFHVGAAQREISSAVGGINRIIAVLSGKSVTVPNQPAVLKALADIRAAISPAA